MKKAERYNKILELLSKQKYLSIDEMTRMLFVSPSTLRRDLAEMSRSGYILRTRGGASALEADAAEENIVHFRVDTFSDAQTAIAAQAAALVRDGDRLFMDASGICLCMAKFLGGKKGLSVVTNSLLLMMALPERKVNIISCAGQLNARNMSVNGQNAIETAAHFHYHFAFFSCTGATNEDITTRTMDTAALLKTVHLKAQSTVFLCPNEKIGHNAPVNALRTADADTIITDSPDAFSGLPCRVIRV